MPAPDQSVIRDQNHNIGKDTMVITSNNSNNNTGIAAGQRRLSTDNNVFGPSMGAGQRRLSTDNNNGFVPDMATFNPMTTMGMPMNAEMTSMPVAAGGQEFLIPVEAFFFSGFQCFEPMAGGSTVAIDNKIEQAMDLVKRHLMYAVREEVEILKQQIGEMLERIGQLEYENTVLRSEAKPETLNKLLQPRVTQPTQVALPTQPTPGVVASTQQQPATAAPQAQQAPVSQVGQPPSTT